jgi:transposase
MYSKPQKYSRIWYIVTTEIKYSPSKDRLFIIIPLPKMPKNKEYTLEEKGGIISLMKAGFSKSEISRQNGIPEWTVRYVIRKYMQTGSTENLPRSGRPEGCTDRQKRRLVRERLKIDGHHYNRYATILISKSQLPQQPDILIKLGSKPKLQPRSPLSLQKIKKRECCGANKRKIGVLASGV